MRLVVFWNSWKHTAAANLQQCTIRILTAFNQGWYFSAYICRIFFFSCLTTKSVFMLLVVSLTSQIKPIFRSLFFYHGLQLDDETEIPHDKADLDVLIGAHWPLITWSCALQDDLVKLVANSQNQTVVCWVDPLLVWVIWREKEEVGAFYQFRRCGCGTQLVINLLLSHGVAHWAGRDSSMVSVNLCDITKGWFRGSGMILHRFSENWSSQTNSRTAYSLVV